MENELYHKVIVPCRESEDGESPTVLHVTKEVNGFGVFLTGYNVAYGTLLKWFSHGERNEAIEYGVNEAEIRLHFYYEQKARKVAVVPS